jgi:hypothetical protein
MDFSVFYCFSLKDCSAILRAGKLGKILSRRENCALQLNRAEFFIFGLLPEKTKIFQ